jgi:hypothetical protein
MGLNPNAIIERIEPHEPGMYYSIHATGLLWASRTHSDGCSVGSAGTFAELSIRFPISVRELMITHLDVFGSPRRYFFELLSHFAGSDLERERLRYFSSKEGAEEMFDYCQRSKRSCFDIFRDFPSAKPSLEYLMDLIPVLQVRVFLPRTTSPLGPSPLTSGICALV